MLRKLIHRARGSRFFRNAMILMLGNSLAVIITAVSTPILTRIYSPDDYGFFAWFLSIGAVLANVICFRYEVAIVQAYRDRDAFLLCIFSLILCFINSSLLFCIIFIFSDYLYNLFYIPIDLNFLYLLPLFVFLSGIHSVCVYLCNRCERYNLLSSNRVVLSASSAIAKGGLGYMGLGVFGLVGGQLLSVAIGLCSLLNVLVKFLSKQCRRLSFKILIRIACKYKDYFLYSTPAAFVGTFSAGFLIIMFSQYFGESFSGYVMLSTQILMIPFSILSTSFSQIFYKKISLIRGGGELCVEYINFTYYLIVVACLIVSVIFVTPGQLFSLVLGDGWSGIDEYIKIFSFFFGVRFVVSTSSGFMWNRLNKQHVSLFFNVFDVFLMLVLFYLMNYIEIDSMVFLVYFCFYKVVFYTTAWFWIYFYLRSNEFET